MFDIGLPEFFILGVIALLVFGPDRLPEVALQAGRLIRRLRTMAESARTELTADLEPHMRELNELRELDPRKMARRYVLDPVDEDGTLKNLRGKKLLAPSDATGKTKSRDATGKTKKTAKSPAVEAVPTGNPTSAAGDAPEFSGSNGSAAGADPASPAVPAVSALPPAMSPAVTPAGARPPYDVDAT